MPISSSTPPSAPSLLLCTALLGCVDDPAPPGELASQAAASTTCGALAATQETVPLPAFAARPRAAGFVHDEGSGIVFRYDDTRDGETRLGYVRPDGSGFSCLSCSPGFPAQPEYLPGEAFPDGARLLLSSGENNSSSQLDYAVLECTPSLARCDSATVVPLGGFPAGPTLQDRVPKLTPDGAHLLWTRIRPDGYFMVVAPLERRARAYHLGEARVLRPPPWSSVGEAGARRTRTAWYEAKSISHDGAELAFAASLGDSLNLDWFTMSLVTGEVTRLTRDPDWDEGGQLAPGGRFMTGGSSRGLGVTASLGAMPRPPLFDHAIVGTMANTFIPRDLPLVPPRPRSSRLVQHLLDRSCADTDAALVAFGAEAEGWLGNGGGGAIWARDGRRFLNNEKRADDPSLTRLRVVSLDVAPRAQEPAQPLTIPTFAPRLADLPLHPASPVPQRLVGPGGGTVSIVDVGDLLLGQFTATYDGYVTEEGAILDGFQRATVLGPLVAHVEEQLSVTGTRAGSSEIDVWFADALTRGAARSELDGHVFERRFGREDCEEVPREPAGVEKPLSATSLRSP